MLRYFQCAAFFINRSFSKIYVGAHHHSKCLRQIIFGNALTKRFCKKNKYRLPPPPLQISNKTSYDYTTCVARFEWNLLSAFLQMSSSRVRMACLNDHLIDNDVLLEQPNRCPNHCTHTMGRRYTHTNIHTTHEPWTLKTTRNWVQFELLRGFAQQCPKIRWQYTNLLLLSWGCCANNKWSTFGVVFWSTCWWPPKSVTHYILTFTHDNLLIELRLEGGLFIWYFAVF